MKTVKDLRKAWSFLFDWSEYITDEAMEVISSEIYSLKLIVLDELNSKMKLGPKAQKKLKKIEKMFKKPNIWKKSILD